MGNKPALRCLESSKYTTDLTQSYYDITPHKDVRSIRVWGGVVLLLFTTLFHKLQHSWAAVEYFEILEDVPSLNTDCLQFKISKEQSVAGTER